MTRNPEQREKHKLYMKQYHRRRRLVDPNYDSKFKERLASLESKAKADPSMHARAAARWRAKNKHKILAHRAATVANPEKMYCAVEGCGRVGERHHPDYNKPEHIIWLCRKHHKEEHVRQGNKDIHRPFSN